MAAALPEPQQQEPDPEQRVAELETLIAQRAQASSSLRWMLSNGLWTLGVTTAQEFIDEFNKYDLTDVADKIACPTLVCEAENDQFFAGQPQMLYDALRCKKTLLKFTAAEGAEEHCHEGALTLFHQRMFDWLDETLAS